MPSFDCFLSHNSKDKPAVRALKLALEGQGVRCRLDEEQLRPGLPWQDLLELGIKGAGSVAVCVAADGIGPWEDEEMQGALRLAVHDGRPVIPVVLPGAAARPELPLFLSNRTWVDLRDGLDGEGLARLVWGITGRPPAPGTGTAPTAGPAGGPAAGPPPLPSDSVFLDEVFELLYSRPTLILLAQADRELNGSLAALRERSKERFGPAQALHLAPPQGPDATESEFFATLGRRAGMQPPPQGAGAFESRLEDRLAAGERLFLLISGLDSCSDAGRSQLAACLRGLSDFHGEALRVVLVGGRGARRAQVRPGRPVLSEPRGAQALARVEHRRPDGPGPALHPAPGPVP